MKWYTGGIAEAITYSKSKGAVFVVYIEGSDEYSQKITKLIDNDQLGKTLEQECFVAVKLQGGSTAHQQFSEIYKEPSIPSIYFIGKNGVPLDIVTGKDNLENICQRIDNILSKAGINVSPINTVLASVASDNFIKNELAENSKVVCGDNGVSKIVDNKNDEDGSSTLASELLLNKEKVSKINEEKQKETEGKQENEIQEEKQKENKGEQENENKQKEIEEENRAENTDELSTEDKVQRAKELLELRRLQKEQEEKEIEGMKEQERRKMGQNVQQLKKWQEDQELKQLKEEREREKRENQQARERVLAQIAQDRAERLSRSQSNSPPAPETSKATLQSSPKVPSNITRLQFKLPDGSSTTHEFENSDILENVVGYIKANLPLPFSNFTLSTVFPRREFNNNDYSQTLIDLQLSPTAVILIIPRSTGPVSLNPGGTLTALIYTLLAPIISIFDFVRALVFGAPTTARTQKRPSPDEPMESRRFSNSKRKVTTDPSTVVRHQGNIHRLSDTNDSDDENNTWNGNSTQQM